MARVNKSQYAILGCLSLRPMSAYEIKSFIKRSVAHFWSESEGQLYPTLRKLGDEGKVISEKQQGQKSNIKIVYSITEDGLKAMQEWLQEGVSHSSYRNELLLKLFFGSETAKKHSLSLLTNSLEAVQKQLDTLKVIDVSLAAGEIPKKRLSYIKLTVDYGLRLLTAEKQWHVAAIKEFKS